ncbi:DUF927 domain-containing protein [Serratia marcescens]|uniref:TOPRIM and DUF927 domain-containing protein n=1 Tax=Serratia marcescens TaxID=615 RepID=UPI00275F2019|nr:TOPRIM and DUF927 domain-containing protein [Serratia marcescens]MDP8860696.1 DUF927 domain-containing protein [Serratia marcescens]
MRNIDLIREVKRCAAGSWSTLLPSCGVTTPQRGKHGPCPICGGADRFHFIDDHGGGEWHCRQCDTPNHGDGLDLLARASGVTVTAAAEQVAGVLGIDMRNPSTEAPVRPPAVPTVQNAAEKPIADRVKALLEKSHPGESQYLTDKGIQRANLPILPDGSLVLPLRLLNGTVTGAQLIRPSGDKKLVAGTHKKGAFIALGELPEQVGMAVICEGYATAQSASLLAPEALVVAALDAGNLLSVAMAFRECWPDAEITLAADNDWHASGELDKQGKPKRNTGKIAAEKAATAVSGWVTLPATEYPADWDDYRQQVGIEQARHDFTDSRYQPQGAQPPVPPTSKKGRPDGDPLKPHVDSRKDGIFWVTPKVDKDSGEIINNESWLCSPLEVIGTGKDDKDQYLIMRWLPAGEKVQTTAAIPLADIGEREGWRTLKAGGVNVTTKSSLRATLADWLQRGGSRDIWRVAQATGWQCGAYIMPDGDIIGTPDKPVLFNGRSSAAAGYTVKGDAQSWRNSVARLADGNYSMMTGIAVALAAPLIGLVGADGFGLHFYEQSSAGKTTTANVASSLYGNPDLLRLTWYGTALGLANEAAAHNDALMPLDEVGQGADPLSVAQSAYALFNGVGKLQGAKEGGNRDLKRWRTMAISTGEVDMETFIAGAGKKIKAGQLVRLLNIPLSKAVAFHEFQNGKQHADALKDAYQSHHGAAGREWVKYLADHQQQAIDTVRDAESRWRALIPADYGEQVHRVAARFAVLEAALLLGRVITGWSEQTCRDAVQHSYNAWISVFGTGNKEVEQIIEQAEAFLSAYGMSRFAPLPYNPDALPISNLAGYRESKSFGDPVAFYVLPATFKGEMAKGFDPSQFARTLHESGRLKKPAKRNGYQTLTPRLTHLGGIRQRAYLVIQIAADEE